MVLLFFNCYQEVVFTFLGWWKKKKAKFSGLFTSRVLQHRWFFVNLMQRTVVSLRADNQDRKSWACACARKLTFMALLEFSPLCHFVDVILMFSWCNRQGRASALGWSWCTSSPDFLQAASARLPDWIDLNYLQINGVIHQNPDQLHIRKKDKSKYALRNHFHLCVLFNSKLKTI